MLYEHYKIILWNIQFFCKCCCYCVFFLYSLDKNDLLFLKGSLSSCLVGSFECNKMQIARQCQASIIYIWEPDEGGFPLNIPSVFQDITQLERALNFVLVLCATLQPSFFPRFAVGRKWQNYCWKCKVKVISKKVLCLHGIKFPRLR